MDLDRIAQAFAAGFTVGRAMTMDAARECLRTGKDFYDRFPKDVNP